MSVHCGHCEADPCHVDKFRDMLESFAVTFDQETSPNVCRRRAVHGFLGRGNRVVVPKCVAEFIRDMFPDPEGQYMGHRNSD